MTRLENLPPSHLFHLLLVFTHLPSRQISSVSLILFSSRGTSHTHTHTPFSPRSSLTSHLDSLISIVSYQSSAYFHLPLSKGKILNLNPTQLFFLSFLLQVWDSYFYLSVIFINQPCLQLESFSPSKRKKILEKLVFLLKMQQK